MAFALRWGRRLLALGPPHRGVAEAQGPYVRRHVDLAQVHQHGSAHQAKDALQVEGAELVLFGDYDQDIGAVGVGGSKVQISQPAPRLARETPTRMTWSPLPMSTTTSTPDWETVREGLPSSFSLSPAAKLKSVIRSMPAPARL